MVQMLLSRSLDTTLGLTPEDTEYAHVFAYLITNSADDAQRLLDEVLKQLKGRKGQKGFCRYRRLWITRLLYQAVKKNQESVSAAPHSEGSPLSTLDREWRAALVLKDRLNYNYRDIASVLETSPDHVAFIVSKARLTLAELT